MINFAVLITLQFKGCTPFFRFMHCHSDLFYLTIPIGSRSSPNSACLTVDPFYRDICSCSPLRRRVARSKRIVCKSKERGDQRIHRRECTIRRTRECGNHAGEWRDRDRRGSGADSQIFGRERFAS